MSATGTLSTEIAEQRYKGLDTWADGEILSALFEGQRRALAAVESAIPALAEAAKLGTKALLAGGRLVYLASGSPALISLGDALEIPQTYGVPRDRILILIAGSQETTRNLTGADEDNTDLAIRDVAAARLGPNDCVIATSASGSTPYTVQGLIEAKKAGAATIAVASNAGAPLFEAADVKVLLATGPEVISGSTRMGTGTAQKAALNMFSTLIGVQLGHVYDGLMVNVRADSDKLRLRAARMISQITGADIETGFEALEIAKGEVKAAVLIAAGAETIENARRLLEATAGNLRGALGQLAGNAG